jgi:hypothetical protein
MSAKIYYWELFVVSCWDEYGGDEGRITEIHSDQWVIREILVRNSF